MYSISELFGKSPQIKIMETFAETFGEDISVPYIEKTTGVVKSTIYQHVYKLLKEGIIKKTKRVGNGQYYQLNENDDRAKHVIMLVTITLSNQLERILRKGGQKTFFDEIIEQGISTSSKPRDMKEVSTTDIMGIDFEKQMQERYGQLQPQPQFAGITATDQSGINFNMG